MTITAIQASHAYRSPVSPLPRAAVPSAVAIADGAGTTYSPRRPNSQ